MTFENHIDTVHRKTMGTLIFINHLRNTIDKETRIMLIQSLALSIVNYCFKIWGDTSKTQIQRVQRLQNFAAKIAVGNARKYDHATPCLNQLNWLKIQEKWQYELCVFMYKRIKGLIPEMLLGLTPVHTVSQATTRQSNDFYIPRNRTNLGSRELAKSGPRAWNALPKEVKNSGSLASFKTKCTNYFFNRR